MKLHNWLRPIASNPNRTSSRRHATRRRLHSRPLGLLFDANNNLLVGNSVEIDRFGQRSEEAFTIRLSLPSAAPVTVDYATAPGSVPGSRFTSVVGTLTFAPGQTAQTVAVPTVNDAVANGTQTFFLNLSNAAGATIARGQGIGTVIDDDTTKFFVVNDGSPDRMYRYGAPGSALASSTLAGGDTAPRGMASNAAGTMVWVADANNTVYVYNAAGALLGTWTAGGLPKNGTVEGITVSGADLWILSNSPTQNRDTVAKYTGAVSRLSGSQTTASSFLLDPHDYNPTGIVTDGNFFWVVDDGSGHVDGIYKYTLAGALVGSSVIDPANTHPTGITINPNNVGDIWIVDSGTLKVYQYTAAATRTSAELFASAVYPLAPGDTNPQDIADPPPPDLMVPLVSDPDAPVDAPRVHADSRAVSRQLDKVLWGLLSTTPTNDSELFPFDTQSQRTLKNSEALTGQAHEFGLTDGNHEPTGSTFTKPVAAGSHRISFPCSTCFDADVLNLVFTNAIDAEF